MGLREWSGHKIFPYLFTEYAYEDCLPVYYSIGTGEEGVGRLHPLRWSERVVEEIFSKSKLRLLN